MFPRTFSLSLLAALVLGALSLGAVEQAPPPFDYLQLIEDARAIRMLDTGHAPEGGYKRVQLDKGWRGGVLTTRLQIADSLTTGEAEFRLDPQVRHAGVRIDAPLVALRLASDDWEQRPGLAGGFAGAAFHWNDDVWRVRMNGRHWNNVDMTTAGLRAERLHKGFAAAVEAQGVRHPHNRWLTGVDATTPLGSFLMQAGVRFDDRNASFPHVRLQWMHGANLLASASLRAELDSPQIDSLFTIEKLAWPLHGPSDRDLDSFTQQVADMRVEWAFGDWRGDAWTSFSKVEAMWEMIWTGGSLSDCNETSYTYLFQERKGDDWRNTWGCSVGRRGYGAEALVRTGELREFESRLQWRVRGRRRLRPYVFLRVAAQGYVDRVMQFRRRTYWTSSVAVEYSGPTRFTVSAGIGREWRPLLKNEEDSRLRCYVQLSYR